MNYLINIIIKRIEQFVTQRQEMYNKAIDTIQNKIENSCQKENSELNKTEVKKKISMQSKRIYDHLISRSVMTVFEFLFFKSNGA